MVKFDLERFCSNIQTHRITFSYLIPPVVLLLGKHPLVDKYDLSSVRMFNSGAAPLTRELVESVYNRLKIPIKQGYGLTETSPTTHLQVSHLTWLERGTLTTKAHQNSHSLFSLQAAVGSLGQTNRLSRDSPPQPNRQISLPGLFFSLRSRTASRVHRRIIRPWAQHLQRLSQKPVGHRRRYYSGRVLPHGRHRPCRRPRKFLHHRPRQGTN